MNTLALVSKNASVLASVSESHTSQQSDGIARASLLSKLKLWYVLNIEERILLRKPIADFYKIFGGHIFFQTLRAGMELGVFDLLKERPKISEEEIAAALNLKEQPCRILLLGLASIGLIKKRGKLFRNSALANKALVKGAKSNLAAYVKLQNEVYYPGIAHFPEAIRAGTNLGLIEFVGSESTLYARLGHDPSLAKTFQDAMEELSRIANHYLVSFLELGECRKVIDVGGGNGTNAITLAKAHPHLQTAVFDLIPARDLALKNIDAQGLDSRVSFIPGDAFQDEFPRGADCFLFCHFMTIWSKAENLALMKKAYAALPPGGRVVIFNMMQNDSGTGPLSAAVGSPYFLTIATGRGMLYRWDEYETLLREAGFVGISRKRLPRDHGIVVGQKPTSAI